MVRAVLWDFGGVILSSPFEAFNRFEEERGLPRPPLPCGMARSSASSTTAVLIATPGETPMPFLISIESVVSC